MIKFRKDEGFTLVELLLATAMFSFVLLFVTAAFVQVSRAYNKGITVKRTQETARAVTQEVARAIGTATSRPSSTDSIINTTDVAGNRRLCVGDIRFAWNEGFRPSGGGREKFSNGVDFALARTADGAACSAGLNEAQSVELIDTRLTIQDIRIREVVTDSIFNICVVVTSNSTSAELGTGNCVTTPACNVINGDTYCDVARLDTTVTLRR